MHLQYQYRVSHIKYHKPAQFKICHVEIYLIYLCNIAPCIIERMCYNQAQKNDNERKAVYWMDNNKLVEKYIKRPNLLRVATELAKFTDPCKATDALLLALKGCTDNPADAK